MTLDQIRTFLWVARLGGVRRAAARLNLSQPAVSSRIATLEDHLRTPLFERRPGGLIPTRAGRSLLAYAEQMLFVEEEIRRQVADREGVTGLFRIGASETVAQSWLPAFMKAFADTFPQVTLDLTVDISLNLRATLLERGLDLAFLMGPISEFTVQNRPLPRFDLHWYKAASMEEVDLTRVPVISYARQTRPHRELTEALARKVGPRARVYSSASLSASLAMIAEGVAVGPYPEVIARRALDAGRIARFDPGVPCAPLVFTASWLADPRNHLAETGAEIAEAVARDWDRASRDDQV
ncbi:LysR family transcriptional regulator [Jannaschia seohaensis]|uniref:DNA-binding transcriptional LysR family regulator n=1 Tax=Jannaschia seohaensis TaxID=475081 RepID=A0A2Y9AWX5_9RHOB|nr:LysR family transcriptional regulator [Jannaschia seohaensis]PWJ16534.1 DNA-binding transcriptional LysR family regulator [Jannaschia seohaensis]SSA48771.1 DNA-binding transcriptional regulator, LysR family [Jannaschia seohaensis]